MSECFQYFSCLCCGNTVAQKAAAEKASANKLGTADKVAAETAAGKAAAADFLAKKAAAAKDAAEKAAADKAAAEKVAAQKAAKAKVAADKAATAKAACDLVSTEQITVCCGTNHVKGPGGKIIGWVENKVIGQDNRYDFGYGWGYCSSCDTLTKRRGDRATKRVYCSRCYDRLFPRSGVAPSTVNQAAVPRFYVMRHKAIGKVEGWEFDEHASAEAKFQSLGRLKSSIVIDSDFNELRYYGRRTRVIMNDFNDWWKGRKGENVEKLQEQDSFLASFILPAEDAKELTASGRALSMDSDNILDEFTGSLDEAVIVRTPSRTPAVTPSSTPARQFSGGSTHASMAANQALMMRRISEGIENASRSSEAGSSSYSDGATRQISAPEEINPLHAARIPSTADVCALETWWGVGPSVPDRRLEASMPGHVMISEVSEVNVMKALPVAKLRDQLPLQDLCSESEKYLILQLNLGKVCLLSLHTVISDETYENVVGVGEKSLLNDALKMIVCPVNLTMNVPIKGPKDADTVGSFFGLKNVHFTRERKVQGRYDIAALSVDLYSVWSLRMLLPSVAFKSGRMVDFHIVSYRDNAVLASYRASMNRDVIDQIQNLS